MDSGLELKCMVHDFLMSQGYLHSAGLLEKEARIQVPAKRKRHVSLEQMYAAAKGVDGLLDVLDSARPDPRESAAGNTPDKTEIPVTIIDTSSESESEADSWDDSDEADMSQERCSSKADAGSFRDPRLKSLSPTDFLRHWVCGQFELESAEPNGDAHDAGSAGPLVFESHRDYCNHFQPLLHKEVVAMVRTGMQRRSSWRQFRMKLVEISSEGPFSVARLRLELEGMSSFRHSSERKESSLPSARQQQLATDEAQEGLTTNDLVVVERPETKFNSRLKHFATIVGLRRGIITLKMNSLAILKQAGREGIYPPVNCTWRLWKVCSLTTCLRECVALHNRNQDLPNWVLGGTATATATSVTANAKHNKKTSNSVAIKSVLQAWKKLSIFNKEQLDAIRNCYSPEARSHGVHLIWGPPGTGKTTVTLGLISLALTAGLARKIVLCAPSNSAVDEVLERLLLQGVWDKMGARHKLSENDVVRVGIAEKIRDSVACLQIRGGDGHSHGHSHGHSYRGTGSLRCSYDLTDSRISNARVIGATLCGIGMEILSDISCDVLIIDEAAQCAEPTTLVALGRLRKKGQGLTILIGDPQQLPATVLQVGPGQKAYKRSLFERLHSGGLSGMCVTTLVRQYRMHRDISCFPSRYFYKSALIDARSIEPDRSVGGCLLYGRKINIGLSCVVLKPYLFLDTCQLDTMDRKLKDGSRENVGEAKVVVSLCKAIETALRLPDTNKNRRKKKGRGNKKAGRSAKHAHQGVTVGIITPYLGQKAQLEKQLRRAKVSMPITVSTVDGFQGREMDIVILACVRSNSKRGIGFVGDEKRNERRTDTCQGCNVHSWKFGCVGEEVYSLECPDPRCARPARPCRALNKLMIEKQLNNLLPMEGRISNESATGC